jgi:hypothetical protein
MTSSRWLKSFLSAPRTAATPAPPPPNSPLRSDFLKEFDQSSKAVAAIRKSKENESSDVKDGSSDDGSDDVSSVSSEERQSEGVREEHNENEISNKENSSDKLVHLFNLPYHISSEQIIKTAHKYGVQLSEVTMNKDATGRPAGSAVGTCQALVSTSSGKAFEEEEREGTDSQDLAEMCAFLLVEKQFGGRPLRVQTTEQMRAEKDRRRQDNMASNNGRYFGQVSIATALTIFINDSHNRVVMNCRIECRVTYQ